MKHIKEILLAGFILGCLPITAWGQAPPPPPAKPEQTPIDGGLFLLTAAGGGYAVTKLKKRNLRNE
ncbi:PID-CTERM protein-sorting domain-containing protein [Rhodohalobacter sp. 614A]|uniref:PID-CTERM protein-sorting domain-containing protein n=1 Tax=Rhodohalobacter sp. 614A TaxID=2908649 RepID=UPI001F2AB2C7|nr:hypothetical protein [Rhodohalobacter sp. 614A]